MIPFNGYSGRAPQNVDRLVYMNSLSDVDRSVYNSTMNILTDIDPQNLSARDRIVLTAHDLFYQEGIRATGVDRIIAQAGVTKVTFYRHFPSKQDLILAFLAYRHERWIGWFEQALQRFGKQAKYKGIKALLPTLHEWFSDASFRGCAFINSATELGGSQPEVLSIVQQHKADMIALIAQRLPESATRPVQAFAIGLAVDGAIVRAQCDAQPEAALQGLANILEVLTAIH